MYTQTAESSKLARKTKIRWVALTGLLLYVFVFLIVLIKFITLKEYNNDYILAFYSITVSFYILIRFGLSFFYEPVERKFDLTYLPTVTFAIPAKNEEDNIRKTLMRIAEVNYPKFLINIIAINDGSTDGTLSEMIKGQQYAESLRVKTEIIDWKNNQGKREAMAECVRLADSELIVFIDSDSFIEKDTLKEMVKYFKFKEIGAVSAHTFVHNTDRNLLTKMQSIHYFVSFKAFKAAEALFGTVTCCPGCCSAYRLSYIKDYIDDWSCQHFLGVKCTYGDDRSLTNFLLKNGYKTVFSPSAHAHTVAPDKYRQFFKQQLRWKKSWTRETILASKYFWKMNPMMVFIFYTGMVLTFLTPFVVLRAIVWYPLVKHTFPVSYLFGLFLMSGVFSLYYRLHTGDKKWFYGFVYSFFYSLILNWQMFYALATLKDQKWGTR